jgi:hypothetical protein
MRLPSIDATLHEHTRARFLACDMWARLSRICRTQVVTLANRTIPAYAMIEMVAARLDDLFIVVAFGDARRIFSDLCPGSVTLHLVVFNLRHREWLLAYHTVIVHEVGP